MYTIYTQDLCGYCTAAKQLLEKHNYTYEEINISKDKNARAFLKGNGYKTVPQIFIRGKHIGGYNDLMTYFEETTSNYGH